jgi:hypothetical protein
MAHQKKGWQLGVDTQHIIRGEGTDLVLESSQVQMRIQFISESERKGAGHEEER